MAVGANDNMLRILQDELESTVYIHRATLSPNLRLFSDRPDREEVESTEAKHSPKRIRKKRTKLSTTCKQWTKLSDTLAQVTG